MNYSKRYEQYSYWKEPWHKWLIVGCAVMQLVQLISSALEYISVVDAGIMSEAEFAVYRVSSYLDFTMSSMIVLLLFSTLVIASVSKSSRESKLYEGILLLVFSIVMTVTGAVLGAFSNIGEYTFHAAITAVTFLLSAYLLWAYKKK